MGSNLSSPKSMFLFAAVFEIVSIISKISNLAFLSIENYTLYAMQYSVQVEINYSIAQVAALLERGYDSKEWLPNLKAIHPIEGIPGQVNSTSKLILQAGNREIVMIETIIAKDLPHLITGRYELKGAINQVTNRFIDLGNNKTLMISEQTYTFRGAFRLLAWLRPDLFKKQSMNYLQQFKSYAEETLSTTTD